VSFELGVNYWPRRSAMYMWRELDIGEVREEMAQIAAIGFDVVRLFTLAQDFLPRPLCVAGDMVANLVSVVRAAKDAGLKIVPTLIVINMSGKFWWPEWMLDAQGRPGDLFSDPTILRTQAMLVETCARALGGDESIRAFDLANEIDDAQRPRTRDAGWLWASLLANTIRRVAPGTPIQIGAHLPSLTTANYMRVDDVGEIADEDLMHAYPLYYDGARSFLDPELVPFSCALTAELSGRGRRPLMQEFGLCTAPRGSPGQTITDDFLGKPLRQYLASEEEGAAYYHAVLQRLVNTGATGAYAWSYGDYDSRLFDREPLALAVRERTFGLVRADGSEKPAAEVFRKFRQRRDAGTLGQSKVPKVLDVSADEYYRAPGKHFARLYEKWVTERSS
jgi:endo-1,4-beta-mannosidase